MIFDYLLFRVVSLATICFKMTLGTKKEKEVLCLKKKKKEGWE